MVWYWHDGRHIKGIEILEINFYYVYGHLMFKKNAKTIQWGKNTIFNIRCWGNWTSTCKRIKLYTFPVTLFAKNFFEVDNIPKCKG